MVTININEEKFSIPDRFTIEQWEAIMKFDIEDDDNWPNILYAATGVPVSVWLEAEEGSSNLAGAFVITNITARENHTIKNLNDITIGEFADLDVYIHGGVQGNMKDIMKILSPDTLYSDNALYVIDKYLQFRTYIFRSYNNLFNIDTEEREEYQESEEHTEITKIDIANNWYRIFVDLAEDDILKIEAVTEIPVKEALNFMAYRKSKREQEAIINKQHELQRSSR